MYEGYFYWVGVIWSWHYHPFKDFTVVPKCKQKGILKYALKVDKILLEIWIQKQIYNVFVVCCIQSFKSASSKHMRQWVISEGGRSGIWQSYYSYAVKNCFLPNKRYFSSSHNNVNFEEEKFGDWLWWSNLIWQLKWVWWRRCGSKLQQ